MKNDKTINVDFCPTILLKSISVSAVGGITDKLLKAGDLAKYKNKNYKKNFVIIASRYKKRSSVKNVYLGDPDDLEGEKVRTADIRSAKALEIKNTEKPSLKLIKPSCAFFKLPKTQNPLTKKLTNTSPAYQ